MDSLQEKRARKLVNQVERAGINCGVLVVPGTVVMRCLRQDPIDTPTAFDAIDLQNAIELDLLEPRSVTGSFEWERCHSKRGAPKPGDLILFSDGTRRKISRFEQGSAFYGEGDHDVVPWENLIPASN